MPSIDESLPCPELPIQVVLPADRAAMPDLSSMPDGPGVFVMEDEDGRCVSVAISANVRRLLKSRLAGPPGDDADQPLSRRIDYRAVARRVCAVPAGSAFETEWAWLQLARRLAPHTYRSVVDRWQAWFVHVDPDATFPQLVKTARPGRPPCGRAGIYLGPIPDKHAAHRYIELIEDAFNLCRYHHILAQAPHGTACAYKEMGRCPAPCDGSISMKEYRAAVRQAVEFATTPIKTWRAGIEQAMEQAESSGQPEFGQRCRRMLDVTKAAMMPTFARVDDLARFRWLAVMPSESPDHVRLFLIRVGWIEPLADVRSDAPWNTVKELLHEVAARMSSSRDDLLEEPQLENVALACRHLFRPRARKAAGAFLAWRGAIGPSEWKRAVRQARLAHSPQTDDLMEQEITLPIDAV